LVVGGRRGRREEPSRRPVAEGAVPGLAVRKTAAALLQKVVERKTPLDALLDEEHGDQHVRLLSPRDRALVRAILGAALRRRGEIDAALAERLDRPLPPGAGVLSAILHVATAQILFLDVPDHAAVYLAVTHAASDRRTGRARGLVNSVLRRIARERDAILARPDSARLNTPPWLFDRWSNAYGEEAAIAIAAEHREKPALDLSAKSDAALWAEKLGGVLLPTGSIRLAEPSRVPSLAGYDEGAWWVQDAAAALPARLLGDVAGNDVADLCAAPGGKTAQLAAAGARVIAVDASKPRLKRLAKNLQRLSLSAELEAADVLEWNPGRAFDAVLFDAPCSATGTIRRHPDIAWLKQPEDIAALAELQRKLLDRAAALVAPGGRLAFATCSLEPEEGESHVDPFLARHPDFRLEPLRPDEVFGLGGLLTQQGTLRTLPPMSFGADPGMRGMDGFFAARFRRS
jgi:16S rRNA (cytosine967-C5)-methyltransferase